MQSTQDVTTPATLVRRRLQSSSVYVVVLGYSLIRTDQLPPGAELKTLMDTPDLKNSLANQLADAGFVTPEQLGQLQVIVTTTNKIESVIQALEGVQNEETTALLALFVPVGECLPALAVGLGCVWVAMLMCYNAL